MNLEDAVTDSENANVRSLPADLPTPSTQLHGDKLGHFLPQVGCYQHRHLRSVRLLVVVVCGWEVAMVVLGCQ